MKTAPFTDRKRTVNADNTGVLRRYYGYIRSVFDPYCTELSGAEIRTVSYPYRKRAVSARFPIYYGCSTDSRIAKYFYRKRP